ncbi:MAG TPA: hypothetical protein VJS66_02210 [Burkholderiales bacterium]|nr:hypothetical protein [Burkholderiales bacterium]
MHTIKPFIALLALSCAGIGASAFAQFPGIPSIPQVTVPITISGRIVKEDGDPLVGLKLIPAIQSEGGSMPAMPSFPVAKLFGPIPSKCFQQHGTATATTDGSGRYTFTAQFLPNIEINMQHDKCSSLRNQLTAANVTIMADPGQPEVYQYEFRKATGPLPTKALPVKGNIDIDATPKTPGGFVPQMKK